MSLVNYSDLMDQLTEALMQCDQQVSHAALIEARKALEQLKKERDACAQVMETEHLRCLEAEKRNVQLERYNSELARDNEYRGDIIRTVSRAVDRFPKTWVEKTSKE